MPSAVQLSVNRVDVDLGAAHMTLLLGQRPAYPYWKLLQLQKHILKNLKSRASYTAATIAYNAIPHNTDDLNDAHKVFDEIPCRTLTSRNSGQTAEALTLILRIHTSGERINTTTFTTALSVCARSASLGLGKQLHCLVLHSGSENFRLVGSALLNIYSSCFEINDAQRVFELLHRRNPLLWSPMVVGFVRCNMMADAMDLFERMPKHDVVSWTALISGFAQSESEKALELFSRMTVKPNEFTFDSVLRACAADGDLDFGRMVHGCLVRCGFESDQPISGALIEFYIQCDAVQDARRVFDQLDNPGVSTSNTLIGSLVLVGRIGEAELVFDSMVEWNLVSYHLMIKGYGSDGRVVEARCLFEKMPCKNVISWNTMMSVYHRNGRFDEALELFECIKGEKDTVSWNSMISGYIENEQPAEALRLYAVMHRSLIKCSRSTFSALFRACANIGSFQQGRMFHARLCKTPFESNVYVGTSLVDMYSKCGSIVDACASFHSIGLPNVASWTALIIGFAHHGHGLEAVVEFVRMLKHGIVPNAVTFVGLLLACGRAGMVDDGKRFFHSMQTNYGLVPSLEHYACMVDLLGHSGYLREAERLVEEMPFKADSVLWAGLLSACGFSMDLEVGRSSKHEEAIEGSQSEERSWM